MPLRDLSEAEKKRLQAAFNAAEGAEPICSLCGGDCPDGSTQILGIHICRECRDAGEEKGVTVEQMLGEQLQKVLRAMDAGDS